MKKKGTTIEKVKTKRMKRSSNSNKQSMAKKKLNIMKTSDESNIQVLMVQNEKLKQDVVKEKVISQQNCGRLVQQVSALKVQLEFATDDLSEANREKEIAIKNQRTDNIELRGQISVAQSRVVTLEDNLATMGAEREGLAKEKEQLRVELEAKEEDYNTTTASNDKAHALKEETIKNERAEKEALAKEKEQLEVELEAKEEEYNTTVASHENELTAKGEEVAHLQEEVAQLQLEKQKLAADVEGDAGAEDDDVPVLVPAAKAVDNDEDYFVYDVNGNKIKVIKMSPSHQYQSQHKNGKCSKCGQKQCAGSTSDDCGIQLKFQCTGGCGKDPYQTEKAWLAHLRGRDKQKGCVPYAEKNPTHIEEYKRVHHARYDIYRPNFVLKDSEDERPQNDQEADAKEWLEKFKDDKEAGILTF